MDNGRIQSLIVTALWTGFASNEDGDVTAPLDGLYGVTDVPEDIIARLADEFTSFVCANWSDVAEYMQITGTDWGQVSHDFHLTRNHHGAGFWDRGAGEVGERLTEAVYVYGTAELCADLDNDGNVVGGIYLTE